MVPVAVRARPGGSVDAMGLSDRRIQTFAAVADTVLPRVVGDGEAWSRSASALGLGDRIGELYDRLPRDQDRSDLGRLLDLMDSRAGGLLLFGRPRRFGALPQDERESALRRMAESRLNDVRKGMKLLKQAVFLFATRPDGVEAYPPWEAMGYPGPLGPPPNQPKPLEPVPVAASVEWTADIVIVGSGAGGGTAAGVLAAEGFDVVVLERGGYRNEADFTHLEPDAYRDLYLDGNLSTTSDGLMGIIAGSTLGGGTVVNYSTSFATPGAVRAEWDRAAGFDGVFLGTEYERSSQAVHVRLGVNTENNARSTRDILLEKGLRDLGWEVEEMPRNVAACPEGECGYCGFGCRVGSKQSTLRTWLEDAAADGARLVVGADVRRVLMDGGRAVGVEAEVDGAELTVRAQAVVLAAGALNTPAIMLRSGINEPAVGRYLRLHPVTAVWGRFSQRVDCWTGIMQSVYSDQFADLDGAGYGFRFETAAVHPSLSAAFFGFDTGEQLKRDILEFGHWMPVGILLRDRDAGRVGVRRDGSPIWRYRLSDRDTSHLRTGVRRAAEVLAAAGADEVMASTVRRVAWCPGSGGSPESFGAEVDAAGFGPNRMGYVAFHQMGSARMGSDPRTSVVDVENRVHGVPGLVVLDGSCFPTASG